MLVPGVVKKWRLASGLAGFIRGSRKPYLAFEDEDDDEDEDGKDETLDAKPTSLE